MATPRHTKFELVGSDGGPLRGDIRSAPGSRPAVVLCHGFKGFKDWGFFPVLAARLARAGLKAISFNFTGSGVGPGGEEFDEPERFGHNTHSRELRDLEIVLEATAGGASATGLFGHSRGGAAVVLHAAAHPESISSLVTWAAIGTVRRWSDEWIEAWSAGQPVTVVNARTGDRLPLYPDLWTDIESRSEQLDLIQAAGRVTTPWLLVHGTADEAVAFSEGEALAAACPRASLLAIDGAGHTFGARHPWEGTTEHLDRAIEATMDHLIRTLD